jgi:DNA-binding LacI/PurR family transcriptional regulator
MKFEAVTIKDIAKALGLSTSTVSRALRGSYEISPETSKMVLQYAESVNYRPNPIALSLKEKRSRSIGIVVCEIANTFFSQVINGIESIAYNRGYHVIIAQSHESYEREVIDLQYLASRSVDGLLVSVSSETTDLAHFRQLQEKGLHIVFFDRAVDELQTHKVVVDNFQGAYDGTVHLIRNGFRRIAHVTHSAHLSLAKERLRGYKQALMENDIPFNEAYVKHCRHGVMILTEIEEGIRELLKLKQKPDAILAVSDRLTTGTMSALQKAGLQVPGDMGLVGFSNSDIGHLLNPPLTTVRQPAFEMGQIATEQLIKLIESKRPVTEYETKVLKAELIVRESSGGQG